jgi:hypothetical protein
VSIAPSDRGEWQAGGGRVRVGIEMLRNEQNGCRGVQLSVEGSVVFGGAYHERDDVQLELCS